MGLENKAFLCAGAASSGALTPNMGYKDQQPWSCLSDRLATMHGRGETPEAIAAALDRDGFRPPKRASRFTAGMVRRLLHELGLRRACRTRPRAGVLSPEERWFHDLARDLALSPHTLHGWRKAKEGLA